MDATRITLLVNAKAQSELLKKYLEKNQKHPIEVALGMSYGQPSMQKAFSGLRQKNCTKILLFPLYPQYASSSSASAMDSLWRLLLKTRNVPEIRTIRNYHDHPAYINALKVSVLDFWENNGKPTKLIMSFHGIPKKSLYQGDPYHCECHKTGRLLAEALKLNDSEYQICFQSRFGRAEWLKPYFSEVISSLGKQKTKNIHVICPGFSSDCLETLEEINIEGKAIFIDNGGKGYKYIPALNTNPLWIEAIAEISSSHLQGWIDPKWSIAKEKKLSNLTKKQAKKFK
jgi:protoporphyrin/coproporphyrin ferrochelatase